MSTPDKVMTPCPSCGARLGVPLTAAGKKIRCPKCQTVVAITADMVTPPPEVAVPPVPVPQSAQRPEVSLGGENTFAGGKQKKYAPESLGDQATFGGDRGAADDDFTDDMEIVDLAGRYKVEGVLGKGGMGEVQLATDTRLNRKVAIKRMLGDAAKSRTAVSRFLIEAKSIAALNHPNIVQIYDYGRDKDGPFLILEYVDGQSLLDKCHNGALSLEQAVDLTCQLCDGLGKAHESGIIHRDIKPANVLMTKQGIPKLTDFGLAKDEASDSGLSVAGAVLGTLDFMPPEQRKDVSLTDARSDLWSLAATLYQMVTGKSPKVIRLNDLPASLQSVLGKALEDKSNDRYQSAADFRNALREAIDESRATLTNLTEGQCPSCGTKNEANRKFCRKCAVSLEVKCLSCTKGMPVWDEICGSCGTKQSPLITSRKEELQQRQHQAEGFLQEGKFREASQIAEKIAAEADPRFQYVKKWSAEFADRLGQEQQQQQQRSGVLHKEAKAHQAAHDYSSAIHALEQIPASLRSSDISALLMQVQGQEERTKELNDEIRLRVERRELDGLIARVDELLQLVPDRVDLRELRETLEKRNQQRLAARSSASLEANRLMDARKYAECVAVLQSIKGSLRTPEIEALQKDAAAKQSRLESLQRTVDQAVKNNQLQGLLAKVDELLLLKSDASEGDKLLREQLVAREQKQKSQIKALLQKVHQLRKEIRFDEAMELLRRVPEELQNEAISTAIDDLQFFADQRSGAIESLTQATNERQIKEALANADEYRGMLTSEIIADKAFESAMKECRQRLEDLGQAQEFSIQRRQRQKKLIIVGSVVSLLLLVAVAGFVIQRQQRLTAIADALQRGDAAILAADFTAAISAYDEVVQLDDNIADAWAGLAIAKLQQTPPDVAGAFSDLEKITASSLEGERAQQARRLGHPQRAIERANAGSVAEALQDIADAEKLSAPAEGVTAAKSAVGSAYLKRAEEAVAANQPEAAVKELEEARSISPQSDQLPRVSQMIADAYLDRADASLQQSAVEPALADIEFARAIQADLPRIPELQAAALVIRGQQAQQAGDSNKASANFLAAKNLSSKAAGLGALAASLADGLVQRCEEVFSDASFQEATATLQTVEEIDGTSATLLALKERLGKVLVSEFDNAIQAKESDHAIELTKSFSALPVPADEQLRLTTAVAAILFQECQNEIAAEELTSAIDAFSKLQKLPVSDVSMRKQANDTLLPGMQTLILAGLKSQDFAPAVNALKEVATLGQINEAFDGQVRDSVQTLQDSDLSPIVTEVLLQSRLSRGLIAYYKLDGNAEDMTTYSGDGIVTGALSRSDRHGNATAAYAFDGKYQAPGAKSIVLPPCGPLGNSPRTISVWARTATRDTQVLLSYGGGTEGDTTSPPGSSFQLVLSYGSYGITSDTGNSAITYQADYSDNQWHHFAWIVPDTSIPTTADIQLFLDGNLVSVASGKTTAARPDLAVDTSKTRIILGDQFTGELDDVRIYNRALTSEEVAGLFKTERPADVSRGLAMPGIAVAPFDEAQAKAHQKAWADHLGMPVETTNSIGMKFVVIPPDMITVMHPIQIGVYEVTQAEYEKVTGNNPSQTKNVNGPVEMVSWNDAVAFGAMLSALPGEQAAGQVYRLPRRSEWEYACRAGAVTSFSFGNEESQLGEYAWHDANSGGAPHSVGTKLPNAWGLYDMHGNLWEWCEDKTGRFPWRLGGAWSSPGSECRLGGIWNFAASVRRPNLGFRLVMNPSTLVTATDNTASPESTSGPPIAVAPFDAAQAKVYQDAWADYLDVPVESTNSIGMKLVLIPPGEFMMGSPESEREPRPDETLHQVTLSQPFQMGAFEVTQSQYEKVIGANPSNVMGPDNPVEQITWDAAAEFCDRLSSLPEEKVAGHVYRLPTEAEWEYACRAGTTTAYSFGNETSQLVDFAWAKVNSGEKPQPVGQKKPNAWGLFDMHGNVWEWCQDWQGDLPSGAVIDPQGPAIGTNRADRGGCWSDTPEYLRAGIRGYVLPNERGSSLGFRVVCEIKSSPAPVIAPFDTAQAKAHQQAWADHLDVAVESTNSIGIKLVVIPPGEFMMGSPDSDLRRQGDETHHRVSLARSFQIGAYEVTQTQYEKVMGENPSHFKGPDNPVDTVSWDDAMEFCHRLSGMPKEKAVKNKYRLPTEAEWEFACRATTTTAYSFGDDELKLTDFAWFDDNSGDSRVDRQVIEKMDRETYDKWLAANNFRTHAVGTKDANDFGLYDMHGNVWEWCLDIHAVLPAGFEEDPSGPSTGSNRSTRGGSADSPPEFCRSSSRLGNAPSDLGASLGFRVYCELESSPETAVAPFDTAQAKAHQKAWADHLGVPVISTNSIGMKFAMIPAGRFEMGSPDSELDRVGNELPHNVEVSRPYAMSVFEVTQEQFEFVLNEKIRRMLGDAIPVGDISWEDANKFCHQLSEIAEEKSAGRIYRLPTEAEWEFACRAGTTTRFGFGDDDRQAENYAWLKSNSDGRAHTVGLKKPNAWGLYDMHGNVWEWCSDWFGDYPSKSFTRDQVGPASGPFHVGRGGAWVHDPKDLRAAFRLFGAPTGGYPDLGFRVVLVIQ